MVYHKITEYRTGRDYKVSKTPMSSFTNNDHETQKG